MKITADSRETVLSGLYGLLTYVRPSGVLAFPDESPVGSELVRSFDRLFRVAPAGGNYSVKRKLLTRTHTALVEAVLAHVESAALPRVYLVPSGSAEYDAAERAIKELAYLLDLEWRLI